MEKSKNGMWRQAKVVNKRGLRSRARDMFTIGEIVQAKFEERRADHPLGVGRDLIVKDKGAGGLCDALVPHTLVQFID